MVFFVHDLYLPSNQCRCQATIQGQKSRRSYSISKTWDHTRIFGLCSSGLWLKLELRLIFFSKNSKWSERWTTTDGWMDGVALNNYEIPYLDVFHRPDTGSLDSSSNTSSSHCCKRVFWLFSCHGCHLSKITCGKQKKTKPKTKLKSGLRVRPLIYNGQITLRKFGPARQRQTLNS